MLLTLLLSCVQKPEIETKQVNDKVEAMPQDKNAERYVCIDSPKGMDCYKRCADGSKVNPYEDCPEALDALIKGMSDVDSGFYNCLQGSQKPDCFEVCGSELKHITEGCGSLEGVRERGTISSGKLEK